MRDCSIFLETIEIYIFRDIAHVYIRNYVYGDTPKFMVKSGVQFFRNVVLLGHYSCIHELTRDIQNVSILNKEG